MEDLDYLSIIILKKPDQKQFFPVELGSGATKESGIMTGEKFIHDIELIIGHFKQTIFKHSFFQREEMEIKETKHHYYMKITGFFFLHPDYKNRLIQIFEVLKLNDQKFHLTRLDHAYTFAEDFNSFSKDLMRIKTSDNITRGVYEKKKSMTYYSCFNSRFSMVGYNKRQQMKVKKNKNEEYRKLFFMKYGLAGTRLEFRLKSKSELLPMTEMIQNDPVSFLNSFAEYAKSKARIRLVYLPRKLKRLLLM